MGRCKLLHCVRPMGLRACPWCKLQGFKCRCLGKTVLSGNRRFLGTAHPLRSQEELFPTTECNPRCGMIAMLSESREHPGNTTYEERVFQRAKYQNAPTKLERAQLAKEEGVFGPYPMQSLPYHNEVRQSHPDGMHVIKQSFSHLKDFLCDSKKVISSWQMADHVHRVIPPQRFALTERELKEANLRATGVIAPVGSSFNAGPVFSQNLPNTSAIHEFQISGVFQWCPKGMLEQQQRRSLFMWLKAIQCCYAESFTEVDLENLDEIVPLACALMERDWPLSFQNITTHLLLHLPQSVRENGPLVSTWMFPFERANSWVVRRALNKCDMASTIMRTYQVLDFTLFAYSSETVHNEDHHGLSLNTQTWTKQHPSPNQLMLLTKFLPDSNEKMEIMVCHKTFRVQKKGRNQPLLFSAARHKAKYNKKSCYVQVSEATFGEIQYFVAHTNNTFAVVDIFPTPEIDEEVHMYFCKREKVGQDFIQMSSLSAPLFVAFEDDKIYFLNVPVPGKPQWLESHVCK
nr:uncharacterized protein LOC111836725 [Paramormyrops kingsleyae]